MQYNTILKGIPVSQNKQEFIIGKITIQELFQFTKYTERVIIGYDEEELPIYNEHINIEQMILKQEAEIASELPFFGCLFFFKS